MVEIRVLGELQLTGAELPASRRACALLGWLAVHPGRHHRSRLAGLFWPDVLDASARASLRSALWALRPALGACLVTNRDTVALDGAGLRVDVREFRQLVAAGKPEAALALYRGDLLQDLDDDWLAESRADLEREVAAALAALTARAMTAGDPAAAAGWARRWTGLRPLDESAAASLIKALAAAGDTAGALDAFGRLRQRLDSELGVGVSAATTALVAPLVALQTPDQMGGVAASLTAGPAPSGLAPSRGGPIGRVREFSELLVNWQAARDGLGRSVSVAGEGGIGKTRLVEELRAAIRPCPAVVAGAVGGQATPFAVWTEALTELLDLTRALEGPGLPDAPWAAELSRIVPALGFRLAGGQLEPQLQRVRIFEAVVQFLGWAARRSPLLLALEDLHLADTASLELVAYAGRRLGSLPVLCVLTRRQLPGRQQLDAVLDALRSRRALTAEIALRPLADDAVRLLVAATAELDEPVTSRIVQLAAGNPLLAVEAARAGAGAAGASLAELDLTGTVRLAVGRLSAPARMFAEFAAAAGRDLDRAEVAALPLPNSARDAAEALGSGLFRTDEGRTGYRHALLRDAVYQGIPDPARVRLHAELAQLLRKRGSASRPRAAEIARHLRLAGQDEQAVSQLALAARDARRVAAMDEAAAFLTQALSLTETLHGTPGDPELGIDLAEIQAFRGLLTESDQAFSRVLEQLAPQDSGALISAWLRRGRWLRGGICHPRESRRCYRNALDVLDRDPDGDLPARAEALAGLAWAEAVAGDLDLADELLAEADKVGGASPGNPWLQGGGNPWLQGGGNPWLQGGGDLLVHDIGVARAHALIRAGQFTESFGPLIAASAAAGRAGRPDMAYSCLANAASVAACAGEFGRALDFADRCLPLVIPNGLLRLSVYAQVARSAILRRLGEVSEAWQACAAAAGYADRIGLTELDGLVRTERGLLHLAGGDPELAAGELRSALALGAPVSRPTTRLRLAEALALAGQPGLAETALRDMVLEPVGRADFPATLVARMSRVQGLIAAARGDPALAIRRFAESRVAWERIVRTLDSRQAGAGYVAALIDLGRPPVSSLVEPAAELALVNADLAAITGS